MSDHDELRQLLVDAQGVIKRYLHEVPLGNQPHLLAHHAEYVNYRIAAALADDLPPLPKEEA